MGPGTRCAGSRVVRFSWYNIPKREKSMRIDLKIYQTPLIHTYKIVIKITFFYSKAFKSLPKFGFLVCQE
jgi:hypothetical protein